MTHHLDNTLLESICELLDEYGFDDLGEAVTIVLNEAMKVERARHLQAAPYERTEARCGYANGFKAKTMKSRLANCSWPSRKYAKVTSILPVWRRGCARSVESGPG